MAQRSATLVLTRPSIPVVLARPSIQRRLISLLLLVGLAPLLLMGLLSNAYAGTLLESQIGSKLDTIAQTGVEQVDRVIYDSAGDVQIFAGSAEARSLDPQQITPLMNRLVRTYTPLYTLMVVADRQGVVKATNSSDIYTRVPYLIGRSVADQEWFRFWQSATAADFDRTYVSDLHTDPLLERDTPAMAQVLAFSFPIKDERGQVIGVWGALMNWHVLDRQINDTLFAPRQSGASSMSITLVNREGLVLASGDRQAVLRDRVVLTAEQRAAIEQGVIARQQSGRAWLSPDLLAGTAASHGYRSYRGQGWVMIATQSRGEALGPVRQIWLAALLIGVLATIAVATLGTLAARSTARPIQQLTEAAARAAEGDLTQRVDLPRQDEVGRLAQAFNHMVAQLKGAQETLEARIAERTASLQSTLQSLQESIRERDLLSEHLLRSSVPLIPLVESVAVLPIVGALDTVRIQRLQECVLEGIKTQRLRAVLLDITAVPLVDTQVALGLIQTSQAARMLGCKVSLVGIRPEVAQTMVQLGLTFRDMPTHATLQAALGELLGKL